jgi:RNA polymerase sigma-70 factor, ECF subfamily
MHPAVVWGYDGHPGALLAAAGTPTRAYEYIAHTMTPPAARDAEFDQAMMAALPHVERFARALARDGAAADDLVQETYLRAFRAWETFKPGYDARRWLFTICRNVFLRERERDARQVDTSGEDAELESLAASREHAGAVRAGGADLLDRIDVGPAIRAALVSVPEVYRTAAVLVDVEGESYESAAEILGVPVGTVRSRLFRARRLLQRALYQHAVDAGVIREMALPSELRP